MKWKNEPRIFVVEDNLIYQQLIAKVLESISLDICFYTTGEACLEDLVRNPDVIILDYQLDGQIDGLDTLKEIRKASDTVCVILFSSQRKINTVENLQRYGTFHFLEKKLQAFNKLRLLVHAGYAAAEL